MKEALTQDILEVLKPVCCSTCAERFPDHVSCASHVKSVHVLKTSTTDMDLHVNSKNLSIKQLREELKKRGLNTGGNKDHLSRRLECYLASGPM